jgi:hypothetical protein
MSKILEALQHLDGSIVPIVLPVSSLTAPPAEGAKAQAKARESAAAVTSNLRDEYSELAQRIRVKLRPPATIFVAAVCPMGDDAWLAPLCVALARQTQGKALIVESSRERTYWSAKLGLSTGRGLSETIGSICDWRETVCATPIDGVSLMPVGQAGMPLPTRLTDRMTSSTAELKQAFPWTIIAGGDARRVESAAFAAACDGAILVVSLRATTQEDARIGYKNLESLGGKVIGCVARPISDAQF